MLVRFHNIFFKKGHFYHIGLDHFNFIHCFNSEELFFVFSQLAKVDCSESSTSNSIKQLEVWDLFFKLSFVATFYILDFDGWFQELFFINMELLFCFGNWNIIFSELFNNKDVNVF